MRRQKIRAGSVSSTNRPPLRGLSLLEERARVRAVVDYSPTRFLFITLLFTCLLSLPATAQLTLPNNVAARSVSGQFVVYSAPLDPTEIIPREIISNPAYVELEPVLLVVSCERIKQALQRELSATDAWSGKINLALHPVRSLSDPITVYCEHFRNNWNYRIQLPQFVERRRFIKVLVQTLLLEKANRSASDRSAEIPSWLTEGLAEHMLNSPEMEIILPPPRTKVNGLTLSFATNSWRHNPLGAAYQSLTNRAPLTLEQLSWPTDQQLTGESGEIYRYSSQLFVTELLRLQNGRDCLRNMIDQLGGCYNWQTAFFRTFNEHFAKPLDLEKWWALQSAHFTGRSPEQLWTLSESWRQLHQTILSSVEVRQSGSQTPVQTEVSFQYIIRLWEFDQQLPLLKKKIRDLEFARARTSPELIPLLDEYRQAIKSYIQSREGFTLTGVFAKIGPRRLHPAANAAIKELDALDAKRLKLQPKETRAAPQELTIRN